MSLYLQHFSLMDRPFRIVPSTKFFFVSETHDEGRARILYGIRENRGFVVVTGGVGLGKTTVLLSVVAELEAEMDVAIIVNPIDSFSQLLQMICEELGVSVPAADEATLMSHLNTVLLNSYARGRGCVLMLDEAQNLSVEVLEKVRTLSNLQTEDTSLLQIVLVGQPELTAKLNDHRIRQLRQRIGVWHEILPLDVGDTADYIWHRLALSGATAPESIFGRKVSRLVHEYSEGIPRLINQISDTALVVAYGDGSRAVSARHVHEAAAELRLDDDSLPEMDKRSGRGHTRRWMIVALVVVALVLVTGAAWTRLGSSSGNSLAGTSAELSAAGLVSSGSVSDELTPRVAQPAAREFEPAAHHLEPAQPEPVSGEQAALQETYARIEAMRGQGAVYTVRLASFRSLEHARRFAREHPGFPEPLFVEETSDQPPWFRVTAGGFGDRASALRRTRELKALEGLSYSQMTLLKSGARPLIASERPGVKGTTAHE